MSTTAWIDELKSAQGLQRLFAQHGAQLAIAVLLTAIAIDAALIVTAQWTRDSAAGAKSVAAPTAPIRPAPNAAEQLASIVNAHLFGVAGVTNSGNAPQTTMPLVLAGVIAIRDPDKGQAIIGQNATSAKLYAVGSIIAGGARLHSVYNDRVLLDRNGALEALMLPRTLSSGLAAAPVNPATQRAQNQRDNSALFGGLVRVQPVFTQGKLSGYRIFPGGRGGANTFTQLGLRSGDLITQVNGTALDDQSRAMEILQTLSSASSATVTVMRNGAQQEVNLNLSNLSNDADVVGAGATPEAAPSGGGRFGAAPPGATASGPTPVDAPAGTDRQ